MRIVTAMDLRKRLGEILDAASAGERILIERDHKQVAVLVSPEDAARLEPDKEEVKRRQLEALDQLIAFGKEWRAKYPRRPGEPSAAEAVRWDRDHRDDEKYERSFGKAARDARARESG
jgi:prevent-host-death family protein